MGCATAYWLRQIDPSLHVVILEADHLAFGASGRNAGFLLLGTHTDYATAVQKSGRENARRLWQFTAENARLISKLEPSAYDLQQVGSMTVAGDEVEADRLKRSGKMLTEDNVYNTFLDSHAVNDELGSAGFLAGLKVSEGGMLNPAKLVRYLASNSGATVCEGCPVTSLESEGAAVRLSGSFGSVKASRVVLTLNAYLPKLVTELSSIVRPVRAQMLATEPVPQFLNHPVYSHDGFYYMRQRSDGRVMLGGARHLHLDEEVGYEDATTDAVQNDLQEYFKSHFPNVNMPRVERRWSGTMGFSPDALPVLGGVPDVDNAIFAAGFTGHGMGFSIRFGQLLARTALGTIDDAFDLFEMSRLETKETESNPPQPA